MDPITFIAIALVVPITIYAVAKGHQRERRLYEEVAQHYQDGRVSGGGLSRVELLVFHGEAKIKVWMWHSKNSSGTVWQAELVGELPEFRVYREGLASSIGKDYFAAQDIEVGVDAQFDRHFMVKGKDPALVRALWQSQACAGMRLYFSKGRMVCTGKKIELKRPGDAHQSSEIRAGIDLIARLSRSDYLGISVLDGLEGARRYADSPPRVVVAGPVEVTLGPVKTRHGTRTRASCLEGSSREDPDPERLKETGAEFSREGSRLHLTWPSIETSQKRLQAGIALLRELARARGDGVFR